MLEKTVHAEKYNSIETDFCNIPELILIYIQWMWNIAIGGILIEFIAF